MSPNKPAVLSERVLQAVRGRIGVDDNESDTSRDVEIRAMDPRQIVRHFFGWHLGCETWGDEAIMVIRQAYGIDLEDKR